MAEVLNKDPTQSASVTLVVRIRDVKPASKPEIEVPTPPKGPTATVNWADVAVQQPAMTPLNPLPDYPRAPDFEFTQEVLDALAALPQPADGEVDD